MAIRPNAWHANHDNYLKENYQSLTGKLLTLGIADIEPKVLRSAAAVHTRCSVLNLFKSKYYIDRHKARGRVVKTATGHIHYSR